MPINSPMHSQATQPQKGIVRYQIALGALALGLSGSLCADALEFSPSLPYVGADVYQRNLTMVQGCGSESFAKRMPQGNLYIGTWFNDYFGLEGGWMFTPNAKRVAYNDTIELGIPSTLPTDFFVANTSISIDGPHLDLLGKIPINSSKFHFIGSIGIANLKVDAIHKPIATDAGHYRPDEVEELTKKFSSRRIIPCFAAGISYPISEVLNVRLLARYEFTAKFKNLHTSFPDGSASKATLSLKNNTVFGAGVNIQF